jgi:hypothetical protein
LALQACSGKVQQHSDCPGAASCGGGGGGAAAGSAAVAGSAADSGDGSVPLAACGNSLKDADESDVDCGGSSRCDRCAVESHCTTNKDCETAFCNGKRCAEPTCSDRVKNQHETGVDCGGGCQPCAVGLPCLVDEDCSEQYCVEQVCTDNCRSGERDSDETDEDCGGSKCEPCTDNRRCLAASDCQSQVCSNKSCRAATCSDQVKNQDESDKDCGGVCGASCPPTAHCNTPADCDSWLCSAAGKCSADIAIAAADVIDDFEDADLFLPASPALGGRVGNWQRYGDGSGTSSLTAFSIERGASSVNGLRTTGKGFTSWGSGFAVNLNDSATGQSTKVPYDASAYAGITFWARAQSTTTIMVVLPDVDTDAVGNTCTTCDHHYFKAVQLTRDWQRFTIAFSELRLEPGTVPTPTAFKPSGVVSLQFRFAPGQDYDLYFDDVAFVKN